MNINLPKGSKPIYATMRDAGVRDARPQRNPRWIDVADDGITVVRVWRHQIELCDGAWVAVIDARAWPHSFEDRVPKRRSVVRLLAKQDGQRVRLVVLEEGSFYGRYDTRRRSSQGRYDDGAEWLVEDARDEILLWRNGPALTALPTNPEAFGHLSPARRELVSRRIERDPKVRMSTLERARNRCEIAECAQTSDFEDLDVHHLTQLGDGGADHTDNTVALCPACHVRIHRGTETVKELMKAHLQKIRERRPPQ